VLEERNVTLGEAQLVLAGLAGLREADRQAAVLALIAVFAARNRPGADEAIRTSAFPRRVNTTPLWSFEREPTGAAGPKNCLYCGGSGTLIDQRLK
jgi:hypothetical protein